MPAPVNAKTMRLATLVRESQKLAHDVVVTDNANTREELLAKKIANDAAVMACIKTAAPSNQLLGGLATGLGVGIPLVAGGAYIANSMTDKIMSGMREESERNWDRIMDAAVGAAGLYALNQLSKVDEKTASDHKEVLEDLLQKVATAAVIDDLLTEVSVGEDAAKLATEMRILNNGYLTTILAQLG